jgi:hypothetical protein
MYHLVARTEAKTRSALVQENTSYVALQQPHDRKQALAVPTAASAVSSRPVQMFEIVSQQANKQPFDLCVPNQTRNSSPTNIKHETQQTKSTHLKQETVQSINQTNIKLPTHHTAS